MPVIHELDRKKYDSFLSKRAERVLNEIRTTHAGDGKVRDGVSLAIDQTELSPDDLVAPLAFSSIDDQILHLAKAASKRAPAAVVSNDYGMQLKCESHGLRHFCPPSSEKLDPVRSEGEKKIRNLQQALDLERNRKARFEVLIACNAGEPVSSKATWRRIHHIDDLPHIEDFMREIEQRHPPLQAADPSSLLALASPFGHSPEVARQYNEQLGDYYRACRKYYDEYAYYRKQTLRHMSLHVVLRNSGTALGEDITASLRLPRTIFPFVDDTELDLPRWATPPDEPTPPKRPSRRPVYLEPFRQHYHLPDIGMSGALNQVVTQCEIDSDAEQHTLNTRVRRLRHHDTVVLADLIAEVDENHPDAIALQWTVADTTNIQPTTGEVIITLPPLS